MSPPLPFDPARLPPGARPEAVIAGPVRDLGDGFRVRGALPSARRRIIGWFGLATVTYLFEGGVLHRDSLGTVQRILPGEVNWMTAGRGIVHSERTPPDVRAGGGRLFGIHREST